MACQGLQWIEKKIAGPEALRSVIKGVWQSPELRDSRVQCIFC